MRKIVLYGSAHWPTCAPVKEVLSQNDVKFAYVDVMASMLNLKTFLKIRDNNESHKAARDGGRVGVPTLLVDDVTYIVSGAEEVRKLIEELSLSEE